MNGPTDVKPAAGAAGDEARDNTAKPTTKRQGRGRSQKSIDLIDAAIPHPQRDSAGDRAGGCYRLFVEKLIDSMEKSNTNKVTRLLVTGPRTWRIPWEWIVDETRSPGASNA